MERSQYRSGVSRALKKIRGTVMVVTAAAWLALVPAPTASAEICLIICIEIPGTGGGGGGGGGGLLGFLEGLLSFASYNEGDDIADGLIGSIVKGVGDVLTGTVKLVGGTLNGQIVGGANMLDGGNVSGVVLDIVGKTVSEAITTLGGGDIFGGLSDLGGNVTGNTVNIDGGTDGITLLDGLTNIVGGVVGGLTGEATGNTVSLDGLLNIGNTLTKSINILGGFSTAEGDDVLGLTSGNILNLGGALDLVGQVVGTVGDVTGNLPLIGTIAHFDEINFADGLGNSLLDQIGLIDLSVGTSDGLVNLNILGDLGLNANILGDGLLSLGLGGKRLTLLGNLDGGGEGADDDGVTTIANGLFQIGNGSIIGEIFDDLKLTATGLLGFNYDDNYEYSGSIIGGVTGGLLGKTGLVGGLLDAVVGDDGVLGGVLGDLLGGSLGGNTGILGGLIKDGSGNLSLLGDLTGFLGDTAVLDGVLQIGKGDLLGGVVGGAVNLVTNVTHLTGSLLFNYDGNINLGLDGSGDLLGGLITGGERGGLLLGSLIGDNGLLDLSGLASGLTSGALGGGLIQNGGGKLSLLGNLTGFVGDTLIGNGLLQIGDGGLAGNLLGKLVSDVGLAAGGLLGFNLGASDGGGNYIFEGDLLGGVAGGLLGQDGLVSGVLNGVVGDDGVLDGLLGGSGLLGGLIKDGDGKLSLLGDLSGFLGDTVITNGLLQIGGGGNLVGSLLSDVGMTVDGLLGFNHDSDYVFSGDLVGGLLGGLVGKSGLVSGVLDGTVSGLVGGLIKDGDGKLSLLGNLGGFVGDIGITNGLLQIGNGGGLLGGLLSDVTMTVDGLLGFNHSGNYVFSGDLLGGVAGGLLGESGLVSGVLNGAGSAVSGLVGGLIKDGSGNLALLGDLSGFVGDIGIANGLLQIGNGGNLVGSLLSDVTMTVDGLLGFNHSSDYVFEGDLLGGLGGLIGENGLVGNLVGGLIKDGDGKLSLLGDLTGFVGDIGIGGGLLQIGDGSGGLLGGLVSDVLLTVDGLLGFNLGAGDDYEYSGNLVGGLIGGLLGEDGLVDGVLDGAVSGLVGGLIKDGEGKLSLLGDLTGFVGDIGITNGLLQIGDGNGGLLGGLVSDVLLTTDNTLNGLLGFNIGSGDDYQFSGDLIGGVLGGLLGESGLVSGVLDTTGGVLNNVVGGLIKDGSGKLSLLGDLTGFLGDIAILDGVLSIAQGGDLVGGLLGGGDLQITDGLLNLVGNLTEFDGGLNIVGGILSLGNGEGLAGLTGGAVGGALNGVLNLTGDVLISAGGLLGFNHSDNVQLGGGLLNIIGDGGLLKLGDGLLDLTGAGGLSYTGGNILLGGGLSIGGVGELVGDVLANVGTVLNFNYGTGQDITYGGNILGLVTGNLTAITEGDLLSSITAGTIGTLTDSGLLEGLTGGLGSLVKDGEGLLSLTGGILDLQNILVNEGTLAIGDGDGLLGTDGVLSLVTDVVSIAGDSVLHFNRGSDDINFSGDILGGLTNGLVGGVLDTALDGTLGNILKSGSGTLFMNGGSINADTVTVEEGYLHLSDSGQSGSRLFRMLAGGPSTRAGGFLDGILNIVLGDPDSGGVLAGLLANLTGNHNYDGSISGGRGTSLDLLGGGGSLTLLGDLTDFLSDISITDSVLNIGEGDKGVGVDGLVGNLVNNILVGLGGTVGINTIGDATSSGLLSGVGTIVKNGVGTLTLLGSSFDATTGTTDDQLNIQIGDANAPVDGNLLRINHDGLVGGLLSNVLFTVTEGAGLELFTDGNNDIFGGALDGLGDVIKLGNGTLTLLGGNSSHKGNIGYGDDPDDTGNIIFADKDDDDSDINSNVISKSGYSVIFDRTANIKYNGVVSGQGSVVQEGTGELTMTGNNTYTGSLTAKSGSGTLYLTGKNDSVSGTTIESNATLSIGNGGSGGSLSGTISNDGNLIFNRADDTTHAGLITGSGTLTKKGSGILTLTADNTTYTGTITVSKGDLVLTGNNDAVTSTTVASGATLVVGGLDDGGGTTGSIGGASVTNNGVLAFNRSDAVTTDSDISGTGSVYQLGSGDLTLEGNNTFTGSVEQWGTGIMTLGGSDTYDFSAVYVRAGTVAVGADATIPQTTSLMLGDSATFDYSLSKSATPLVIEDLIVGNITPSGQVMAALDTTIITNSAGLDIADEEIMLFIPKDATANDTVMSVQGDVTLSGDEVTIDLFYPTGRPNVEQGESFKLIEATEGGTLTANDDSIDVVNITFDEGGNPVEGGDGYSVHVTDNGLSATLTSVSSTTPVYQRLKAYAEGQLAGVAFTVQGQDFVVNQGISSAMNATSGRGMVVGGFGSVGASRITYNTGSHIDVDGQSLMVGLAIGNSTDSGRFSIGAFFENGDGSYDSYNSFTGVASVHGEGDTSYTGGGVLLRYDVTSGDAAGMYVDASARMGRTTTDFRTDDITYNTWKASFENSMNYYSLHAGLGYVAELGNNTELDMSAKLLWTNQEGADYTVYRDEVSMDDTTSLRTRVGGRLNFLTTSLFSPYLGAYWEHEFDGETTSRVNGYEIEAPSMSGDTAMGEMGFAFRPSYRFPMTLDLNLRGYTGKHKGVGGALQLKFEF